MRSLRTLALALPAALLAGCAGGTPPAPPAPRAAVTPVENPAAPGSTLPSLAARDGAVLLSWIEDPKGPAPSLRAALFRGGEWSATRTIAAGPEILIDPANPPEIAILEDGALAAAWVVKNPTSAHASDVRFSVSRDGGASWSEPVTPHRDRTATEHGFVSLVPRPGAGLDLLWLDGRAATESDYGEGGTQLFAVTWDGETFGPETVVDPRVCDCCRTAAARVGPRILAAYRDRGEDERRDISIAALSPSGWEPPRDVAIDGWRLTACPTNGPALAVHGDRVAVAWFTAAEAAPRVRIAVSKDGGASFGEPLRLDGGDPIGRVDAAALPGGVTAVSWLEKKGARAEVRVALLSKDGTVAAEAVSGETTSGRGSGTPRVVPAAEGGLLVAWVETALPGGIRTALVN